LYHNNNNNNNNNNNTIITTTTTTSVVSFPGSESKTVSVDLSVAGLRNAEAAAQSWKFFNPGTRTLLEVLGGRIQIIGSRRIQMLVEAVPATSKFLNATLYIQNGDKFESIENCARCKENGIPNVFCVLPKRGREYDSPWITFRITCTSTAKHWKGSPFWIGAEFLTDPAKGTISKIFSPPIHVQSKVKSKDLERTGNVPVSPPDSPVGSNQEIVGNQSNESSREMSGFDRLLSLASSTFSPSPETPKSGNSPQK
jgi:hypothetical protein